MLIGVVLIEEMLIAEVMLIVDVDRSNVDCRHVD